MRHGREVLNLTLFLARPRHRVCIFVDDRAESRFSSLFFQLSQLSSLCSQTGGDVELCMGGERGGKCVVET